ncbi:MAG TPA: hypothetical protein VJC13_00615 [Candidatus Paceibacterota bacterium]
MMRTLKKLGLLLVLVTLTSACAVPVRGGGRMYVFGGPQVVVVTNNTRTAGDLFETGRYLATLGAGDSYNVELGWTVNSNKVLTFKAFELNAKGERVYMGQVTRTFYPISQSSANQEWTVDYVQPPR